MADSKPLSADSIRKIITEEEIPLRSRSFDPGTVNAVFRYGASVGHIIEHHEEMGRGMDRARQLIHETAAKNLSFASGTVIIADAMTQSRGRFTRSWLAPPGGLWMTLVLVNTLLPESSLLVPMAAGVSCSEVLRSYGLAAHIKWVNDILIDSRKVCGILTESFNHAGTGEEYILVGIGINVNNDSFPAELAEKATSLKSCLKREISLPEISARLLAKLRWNIGLIHLEEDRHLETNGGIAQRNRTESGEPPDKEHLLLASYKHLTDTLNRRVVFGFNVEENPQFEARVVGLDNSGGLILEMDDLSRVIEYSGEVTYLD